jgi:hypothetical protein
VLRWQIRSEREVQDILLIMLRSVFDDVIDEDTLPEFGHKGYRSDFGRYPCTCRSQVRVEDSSDEFEDIGIRS